MTNPSPGSELAARYARAVEAARVLPSAQLAAAKAWEKCVIAEDELARCVQVLDDLSGVGPATWGSRLTGRLSERRETAQLAVQNAEAQVAQAVAEHKVTAVRVKLTQARADDLPAAREAASAALSGPDAELALATLAEANELAEAMFAVQSARLAATGVGSQLSTARNYSTYDTFFGGGMVASLMKHDALDSAHDPAHDLVVSLATLRSELQDLNAPTAYFAVHTNDVTGWFDVWWDNVFSDLAVARQINNAQDRIERLLTGLDQLAVQLGERRQAALDRLDSTIASGTTSANS